MIFEVLTVLQHENINRNVSDQDLSRLDLKERSGRTLWVSFNTLMTSSFLLQSSTSCPESAIFQYTSTAEVEVQNRGKLTGADDV